MSLQSRHRLTSTVFVVCIALLTIGCEKSKEARKLDPPDDIDWAAIEAEGEAMNEEQKSGE